MSKLDKLRDAVEKRDKRSFIDSIHDFSEDDITRLTKQELEEILSCCAKMNIKRAEVEEFFNFLFEEGLQALENLKIEKFEQNVLIGRFYFSIFLALCSVQDEYFTQAAGNLGNIHLRLAELGIDPINNLKESIKLYKKAKEMFKKDSIDNARTAMNMGSAHRGLARLGIDPINNLIESIILQKEARKIFPKTSLSYARATMNEGNAHTMLAQLKIDSINNLKESIKLHEEAINLFQKQENIDNHSYALAFMNCGNAYFILAELGVDTINNLKEAIKLMQNARKTFPETSLSYANATLNMGNIHRYLARLGVDPINNSKESIRLYHEAREIFPKYSLGYANSTLNQAITHSILAVLGIESEKNLKIAEELYGTSGNIFLDTNDGWGYSHTILGIYTTYRNIFWKNGDKSFLEKANISLKEAKKNIETWEVLRKNEILGALDAVEADLCQLEDDYYGAGMSYRDAYRMTKNEYYRFMCEFCGAKSSQEKNSFCKLADKWKEIDKEGIFLDFYDYAVFECHLEEAVENEALRFDEVNRAKGKLDEIHARTPIYHVKTRVGACIDILNAYLNYFPEKDTERNEEKAIGCITSACRAFKSLGNKPEIELCNMFSKAIKNKDSKEVLIHLIKNHLSSNLSKLIGETAINEMVKSQTIRRDALERIDVHLEKIEAGVNDIRIKIDGLKTSFEELSKKCDAETQELIGKISEEIIKKLEERDEMWLEKLKEELIRKSPEIEKEISSSEVKSKWRQLIDKLKARTIPQELFIILTADEIRDYFVPFLSSAVGAHAAYPVLISILAIMGVAVSKEK